MPSSASVTSGYVKKMMDMAVTMRRGRRYWAWGGRGGWGRACETQGEWDVQVRKHGAQAMGATGTDSNTYRCKALAVASLGLVRCYN